MVAERWMPASGERWRRCPDRPSAMEVPVFTPSGVRLMRELELWRGDPSSSAAPALLWCGPPRSGKTTILEYASSCLGMPLCVVPHAEWVALRSAERAALLDSLPLAAPPLPSLLTRLMTSSASGPSGPLGPGLLVLDNASASGPFNGWCGEALAEAALPWAVCVVVRSDDEPDQWRPAWPASFRRWSMHVSMPPPELRSSFALLAALRISGQRYGQPALGVPVREPLPSALCDAPDVVELLQLAWCEHPVNDGSLARRAAALLERHGPRLLLCRRPAAAAAAAPPPDGAAPLPASAHTRRAPEW